jgi:3-isopropylmalate/(R)-2-methylmalate dehydratase small subunit
MKAFKSHTGIAAPLNRANIDTDQIIPKQFLTRIERTGYGQFLFFDWRFDGNGNPTPDFVLNQDRFTGASVLIAGKNFGCGSSREHAPWALEDFGFRVIIAPSFADIFYNNCFKVGILPIALAEDVVAELASKAESTPGYRIGADLENQTVSDDSGFEATFDVDAFRRFCLINGLDDIGLSLQHESAISEFENSRAPWLSLS